VIKQGILKKGVTPSAVSGKPADMIKSGEALRRHEKLPRRPENLQDQIHISNEELQNVG